MYFTMHAHNFPFAVRLIGFPEEEAGAIEASFAGEQGDGYGYCRLLEDNLQDPDLYLVNADELKALVTLSDLTPSEARPALLVGDPHVALPYPRLDRPLQRSRLFEALNKLVEKRADALSRLDASGIVSVPERRRRDRLDLDLTDPSEYQRMRRQVSNDGGILIVDKNPAFREHVSELLRRYNRPVAWVNEHNKAVNLCNSQNFAVVLINTSILAIDPYLLCEEIKLESRAKNTIVIFLIGKPFVYDLPQARHAGVDGFLNKPIATHHLLSALKKFLPGLSR
jgi:CheY-like chemotaxis protein